MALVDLELLTGAELHARVVQDKLVHARESLWLATANVKAMMVPWRGRFVPVADVMVGLVRQGVEVRLLHAEVPSRPFRAALERHAAVGPGTLTLRSCPRVHMKAVIVDGAWVYLGSANLTGAGLGAKDAERRNFEVGLGTEDYAVVDHVTALFQSIWSGAECAACKLYRRCPAPLQKRARAVKERKETGLTLGRARKLPRRG